MSVVLLAMLTLTTAVHGEIRPDFLMESDPTTCVLDPHLRYSPKLKPLWLEALSQPEHEMQRRAAETIARAHRLGVPGLDEAIPRLEELLLAETSHRTTRLAAARALGVLPASGSAQKLFDAAQRHGIDMRQLIEPVLAEWNFAPAREVWRKRLGERDTRPRDLVLAIRCLARVGDTIGVAELRAMALNRTAGPDVRLEAARAVGLLTDTGLEPDVERLTRGTGARSLVDRLCAVRLLGRHSSTAAQAQLIALAQDTEPAIAGAALTRLNEIDASLVLPLAEAALVSPDAHVRRQAAESYIQRPTSERVSALASLLDDPHPNVRGDLREALFKLEQSAELKDSVRQSASRVLMANGWRGQEQAALLLGALDHEPVADRLVNLLESTRPEVMVASAWALRKLEVERTLPALLDKATRQTELRVSRLVDGLDRQVAHLFETFGRLNYAPAEPLLMQYVPKSEEMGEYSRTAAIWSLGWLHDKEPDEKLARQLWERLMDETTPPSEFEMVCYMSVVSLGRMKATSFATPLRERWALYDSNTRLAGAMRWTILQLTGEQLPEPEPGTKSFGTWFLEPLDSPEKLD